jgi:hypothetical protein
MTVRWRTWRQLLLAIEKDLVLAENRLRLAGKPAAFHGRTRQRPVISDIGA